MKSFKVSLIIDLFSRNAFSHAFSISGQYIVNYQSFRDLIVLLQAIYSAIASWTLTLSFEKEVSIYIVSEYNYLGMQSS